jgi:glycosyltransferase involved in cell wall biosynthesis
MQLCAPAHVGGLERVVQGLSTGLAERGHSVTVVAVVAPGTDTSAFVGTMARASVETRVLELSGRAYLSEARAVARLFGELGPDVVHTHGYRPDLLHGGAARRRGIATVSTLHGSSRMGGLSHVFEWMQERALRRFDAVVAVSRPLVDALRRVGVPEDRIHLVPNAWTCPADPFETSEARARLGVPADRQAIGWVGRLIPIKGPDVFLRALAELPESGWHAVLVGDGPERGRLHALRTELGLEDKVGLVGAIDDAARLLAAFDVFVLSSRSEGTPMVLLEAFGAGVPVVATAVGGVPHMFDHAEGEPLGWLVPKDSPTALARAIQQALRDPGEARARGARARERTIREYAPEQWIERHERVYLAAIERRSAVGPDLRR